MTMTQLEIFEGEGGCEDGFEMWVIDRLDVIDVIDGLDGGIDWMDGWIDRCIDWIEWTERTE